MTNFIITAILKVIWTVVIQVPLMLINAFDDVFKYLTSGIFYDVLFGGKSFSLSNVPVAFYAFCVVALLVALILFFVHYFTLLFIDELTIKERFVKSMKSSLLGVVFTIFIPCGFFIMCTVIDFLQKAIAIAIGGQANSFAKMLYKLGDPSWNGSNVDSIPSTFSAPSNIKSYNFITEIAGVWFMLYTIAMTGMAVAQKVFELYCLFIVGPLFAATMPNDNGVRMKQWKDSAMGKMLVSCGTVLVYDSFIVILMFVIKTSYTHFDNVVARQLMTLLALLGGGVYCQVMPSFFANFVNERVGAAEGRQAISSARAAGGMLKSAATGGLLALGVGKAAKERAEADISKPSNKLGIAPNAQQAISGLANSGYRRTGLTGLAGSGIRAASSVVGATMTAGAAVGAVFGSQRGKERVHAAKERVKTNVKNGWNSFKEATHSNTKGHAHSKQHFSKKPVLDGNGKITGYEHLDKTEMKEYRAEHWAEKNKQKCLKKILN